MSSINNLPPPFPNAAQSLSKVASDAQLKARIERASESAPIKTEFQSAQSELTENSTADSGTSSNNQGNTGKGTLDVTV